MQLRDELDGLDDEALNWVPVPGRQLNRHNRDASGRIRS
jgi:hypothetical protein